MQPCTDEDFKKFYPIEKRSAAMFESYRKNGGLYCIDWQNAKMELFGTWRYDSHFSAVDIMVAPCGMSYTLNDGSVYEKDESECIWDKEEFYAYLGETY